MKLPDKRYDILKWVCLIFLPACAWLILQIGAMVGIPNPERIAAIINAVATFIGLLIGVSTYNYNKTKEEG